MSNEYFLYGPEEINYLKSKDPVLGKYIDQIGIIKRGVNSDLFSSLVNAILSQQISSKAALTVSSRLKTLAGEITPESLLKLHPEDIQKCGLSHRKVSYILDLSQKVINNEFDIKKLNELTDEEVIKSLVNLKGIGPWTAEMLMIFSMKRQNILSFNDLAIQRGLRMLYQKEVITKEEFNEYWNTYRPYASIASLYLWDIATNGYGLIDPLKK